MAKPQVSIAALLLTIAAVAGILTLMFQAPVKIGTPTMVSAVPVALALLLIGITYGKGTVRPFCIGAVVPVAMMCGYVTTNLSYLKIWLTGGGLRYFGPSGTGPQLPLFKDDLLKVFGGLFLTSIALGYLCLLFRWFVDWSSDDTSKKLP